MKCIHKSKFVILILVVILACVGLLSGCGSKDTDTLVIGNGEMNGVFNPFFVETNADQNVVKLTAVTLNRLTENGLLEGYASEYIAPEEILGADGQVDFTKYIYKIKNDVQFSDGTPVTAEDVIFSIKVLCDPSYNGLSTINTLPIVGLEEYIYDTADYNELIAGFENEAKQIDKEYVLEYIKAMASEAVSTYSEEELTAYMGIELDAGLKGRERQTALEKEYYEFEAANAFDYYIEGAQAEKVKQLKDEYISDKAGNFQIQEIEGVKAIDDRTVEITLAGVNPSAVWDIGEVVIAPEHYYGKGFEKGDLASVRSKDGAPLGAGPYVFESYQNNVVTMSANKNYFLGKPNIPKIKFAYTTKANTVDGIALGEIDIADVEATQDEISKIEENKLYYMTTDFQGYGYIGINSNRINDINVRKGLMSLINKEPAVNTYFGGLASVIERPASADSWVYPADSKPVYTYNKDKALEYFKAAGYTQETKNGKNILSKDGQQLSLAAGVGGEGTMDHPAALIFTQMKLDLEEMGGKLEITDCDLTVLTDGLYQGSFDLWAASWDTSIDPSDMNGIYLKGAEGNFYGIASDRLDSTLMAASAITDMEARKNLYAEAMDIIMAEAVEMPVYQRKNLYVFNPEIVDISSLPAKITEYSGYLDDIEKLKFI